MCKPVRTHCRYCGDALKAPGARTCATCREMQIPYGMLLGKISIANFALFGSIIILLFSNFSDLLHGQRARINMRVLNCDPNKIRAALFNSGSTPGVVTNPAIYLSSDQTITPAAVPISLTGQEEGKSPQGAFTIPPGGMPVLLDITFANQDRNEVMNSAQFDEANCQIHLSLDKVEEDDPSTNPLVKPACDCRDVLVQESRV